jgi:hypothetical protein
VSETQVLELHFASTAEGKEDTVDGSKIVWRNILKEGVAKAGKKKVPFKVIPKGKSSISDRVIAMEDLIASYDDKAFDSVTIPDGHVLGDAKKDSALNNTGYVNGLRVVKDAGVHYLQAAMGFTEPDAAAKAKRGSIPAVSSGILLNYSRRDDDKKFPAALHHVSLERDPAVRELNTFQRVYASDDAVEDDVDITLLEFQDKEENSDAETGEIVWNEKDGTNWLREALSAALRPDAPKDPDRPYVEQPYYYVQDLSQSKGLALVQEDFKGEQTRWVIPFTVAGDEVKPGPSVRWVEGRDALIAASDEFSSVTTDAISQKISDKLSGMEDGDKFEVAELTLDNRCHIQNKETGSVFEASFAIAHGGAVLLSDASEWERVGVVEITKQPAPKQKGKDAVVQLFDVNTPEGRVAVARQRRRQIMQRGG